jgi:hypothetical protein
MDYIVKFPNAEYSIDAPDPLGALILGMAEQVNSKATQRDQFEVKEPNGHIILTNNSLRLRDLVTFKGCCG